MAQHCEACGSRLSSRRQWFHKDMAEDLKTLVFMHDQEKRAIHTRELRNFEGVSKASIDMVQLKHWGLIEPRGQGWYEPTALGRRFVEGKVEVPAYVKLENNKPVAWGERQVDFAQVMGTAFDYATMVQ